MGLVALGFRVYRKLTKLPASLQASGSLEKRIASGHPISSTPNLSWTYQVYGLYDEDMQPLCGAVCFQSLRLGEEYISLYHSTVVPKLPLECMDAYSEPHR